MSTRRSIAGVGGLAVDAADSVLARLAGVPLERLAAKNDQRAMADPVYAGIQERRNEERMVSLDDFMAIMSIREALDEQPWWERPARAMANRPITRAVRRTGFTYQKARRGWSDDELWSLDRSLARRLGAQLTALASTTHGWPQSEKYPTFEDWQIALRTAGTALTAYAESLEFHDLDPSEEDFLAEQAADALRWVADNFTALWD